MELSPGRRKCGRAHEKGLCAAIATHYQANNMNNLTPPTHQQSMR